MSTKADSSMNHQVADVRGLAHPRHLQAIRRAVDGIKVGDTLEVKSSEAGTDVDVLAWCRREGHTFLRFEIRKGYDSLYLVRGQ